MNGLDVFCRTVCYLHDPLTLMELRQELRNELAEAELRVSEAFRWQELVLVAEEDSEAFR